MSKDPHFSGLERMYLAAPVNEFYRPTIEVGEGRATVEVEVGPRFFHAAGAVHGSVYFKMLDDAAFFAANSLEREVFVLTASFATRFRRPVTGGRLKAVGKITGAEGARYRAEAVLFDESGTRVAEGSGVFARSRMPLAEAMGYAEPASP